MEAQKEKTNKNGFSELLNIIYGVSLFAIIMMIIYGMNLSLVTASSRRIFVDELVHTLLDLSFDYMPILIACTIVWLFYVFSMNAQKQQKRIKYITFHSLVLGVIAGLALKCNQIVFNEQIGTIYENILVDSSLLFYIIIIHFVKISKKRQEA